MFDMSFLDELAFDQKELLISLPYRVGLLVSRSDTFGGDDSDEKELQALSNILNGYAQEVFGSETVQYIISETVKRKEDWPNWSKNLETIEDDCHKAIDVLSQTVDEKEVSSFKQHLLEIGEAVAMAFREYDGTMGILDKIKIYFCYVRGKKAAALRKEPYKSYDQFLNISLDERKALTKVATALNTTYI